MLGLTVEQLERLKAHEGVFELQAKYALARIGLPINSTMLERMAKACLHDIAHGRPVDWSAKARQVGMQR